MLSRKEREEQNLRNKEIEEYLRKEKTTSNQVRGPKILLLGSGDSGKTTVLKQMKILHGNGFSDTERIDFRKKIIENIVDSIHCLVDALEILEIPLGNPDNQFYVNQVQEAFQYNSDGTLPLYIVNAIKVLWNDLGIKQCYMRSNEFFIQDTADYFLDDVDRFVELNYMPTDEDILNTRYRTSEISETRFKIDNLIYRIYDVGGQRSYRLFWAPYFEGEVHAVQFVASLAGYDQQLVEQSEINRMVDALELFKSICDTLLLKNVNIILFLNKADLFEKKIQYSRIEKYFPDYKPGDVNGKEVKHAGRFFKAKFLECNTDHNRKIYTHFTTGTNTTHMRVTISAVRDIVTRLALQASGIY